jgi:hypothetical protein
MMADSETAKAAPAIAGSDLRNDERFGGRLQRNNTTTRKRWEAARRLRLQILAARLHRLGPAPLYHFLREIESGASLRAALEDYARLPADFVKAYGGDRFAPGLWAVQR